MNNNEEFIKFAISIGFNEKNPNGGRYHILEYKGRFRMRIVGDRGQLFCDFATLNDEDWLDGGFLMACCGPLIDPASAPTTTDAWKAIITTHVDAISIALAWPRIAETRRCVAERRKQYALERMARAKEENRAN